MRALAAHELLLVVGGDGEPQSAECQELRQDHLELVKEYAIAVGIMVLTFGTGWGGLLAAAQAWAVADKLARNEKMQEAVCYV